MALLPIEDIVIRPSMKTVWAAYTLTALLALALIIAIARLYPDAPGWLEALPVVILLAPVKMHLSRSLITLRLQGGHLTLEAGLLSRTRRTVDMAKIQDVTVNQTLFQRLIGTGDIMLESAGERGAMSIPNIDRPRVIADAILNTSKQDRKFL
jgi:uncharacterized membrane protein YdbT with pleckstrin-like domain